MKDDLISRQAAIKTLLDEGLITAAVYIERLPTVDPRKGKWEVINEKEEVYSCSECGFVAWGKAEISNYCPNCGARMEE